jgi:N-acetylglucosamine malate deacetylase 1
MRLLAVFAHPDDELGCVGTLKKHAQRGDEVMLVWTTHGELASQFVEHSDEEVRRIRQEHGAWIADKVGGKHHFFDMGDSRMRGSREEALQLARLYATFKPDAIITWSDDNPHPDHRMTAKIVFDAITLARIPKILNEDSQGFEKNQFEAHRKDIKLYQYVTSTSNRPVVHINIAEQMEAATEMFKLYQEFYKWQYTPEQFKQSREINGREVGFKFAEKFQLRQTYHPGLDYLQ